MRGRGHPVLGGITGFLFGLSVSAALLAFGALKLSSVVLVIVPLAMLVIGVGWGAWAPLGSSRQERAPVG